ncbi:MAG: UbiD family decarboxylase [Candidatus Tectomicrobia bacterium]|nr:UbiD family decarboxylase [Candidatus Tectomicrobia bacterium]
MSGYRDLHVYVEELERHGKLIRISSEINKDTELMPLVRLQFRGLPEEERKAFLFENVTDSNGRRYAMPVLVGALAASRDIYCLGMQCEAGQLLEKWTQAQLHPIPPRLVEKGPVHEVVLQGDELLKEGQGLDRIPIPISTPGFDCAPYTTMSHWITRDPETGLRNLGNYRGHLKSSTRLGIFVIPTQDVGLHWQKCRQQGKPLQAALILGCPPHLSYTAVAKLPGLDELSVAGALAGEPVELVRCKTVDLEVPAWAEIVVEGNITTEYVEPEAPFGEFVGFIGERRFNPYFEVSCITHRRDAIYGAILSQFPPSESSKIRQMAYEPVLYKHLRHHANIDGVLDVAFHESGGAWHYIVIQLKKTNPSQPMQALNTAVGFDPTIGKIFVAVDETVDPRDPEAVNWALCYFMQPHRDMLVVQGRTGFLDHSGSPQGETDIFPFPSGNSALLIDATRKWPYPPISLPRKDLMEHAMKLWEREGLPPLRLKSPWHGYNLGKWSEELEEEAEMALRGDYFKTGEKLAQQRRRVE